MVLGAPLEALRLLPPPLITPHHSRAPTPRGLLQIAGVHFSNFGNFTAKGSKATASLYTQKTGVAVKTVLPEFAVFAPPETPRVTNKFFFWSGSAKLESLVRSWQTCAWSRDPLALSKGEVHAGYTEGDDPLTRIASMENNGARGGGRTFAAVESTQLIDSGWL
jgi:hypothetical protein